MELNPEFMVSFDLVSALQAGYRAQLSAQEILQEHSCQGAFDLDTERSAETVRKIDIWCQQVWEGQLILHQHGDGENADRLAEAIDLTEELSVDLDELADAIQRGLTGASEVPEPELYALLTAGLTRNALANLHNIQTSIEFARVVGHEELAARYEEVHPEVLGMVEQAEARARALESVDEDPLSWDVLLIQAASLPGVFRGMRNDLLHLLATLRNQHNVEIYDISETEWLLWENEGFDPFGSGAWKAFGFDVYEASEWVKSTGCDPRLANEWRSRGFDMSDSYHWSMSGFTPEGAACWQVLASAGIGEAAAWRARGSSLHTARRWHELGCDVEAARAWSFAGVDDPTDASIFKAAGIEQPAEAIAWQKQGIACIGTIKAWKQLDLGPEDSGHLHRAGYDPTSARELLNAANH